MSFIINNNEIFKAKFQREEDVLLEFKNGLIKFDVASSAFEHTQKNTDNLLEIKAIFQRQLPKMPKEYILRQVFDMKHRNLFLVDDSSKIIGGICYRPFYEKYFCEIVFCAIENECQVKGRGGFMMDLFKEHCKLEMFRYYYENKTIKDVDNILSKSIGISRHPNCSKIADVDSYLNSNYKPLISPLYFLTYADNFAIGYFKKQGFSKDIRFKNWIGFIKDYDGGTLMQCKLIWELNYLKKHEFIQNKRDELISKLEKISEFNIIRDSPDFSKMNNVYDIPGIKEAKLTNEMLIFKPSSERIRDIMYFVISELQAHPSAWPFLKPVNKQEVPDYFHVIKNPMDLSTMERNLRNELYEKFEDLADDFFLMINNCYFYNAPSTQYFKCAQKLEEFYSTKLARFRKISSSQEKDVEDNFEKTENI
ncbi:GCN5-like bromodomain-containing histone acetyltransferase [Hamiltosporidium magnivora]|uniref:histone acetyltransferase n=1 Tax=Hamiltosporidium magnivora TaxID=148818 RepID=A0A4Q9L7H6_9MICR|nr:GCN5-like bromodomain-containing histone acetyltransferase [Hamiltosporidium magnivora]